MSAYVDKSSGFPYRITNSEYSHDYLTWPTTVSAEDVEHETTLEKEEKEGEDEWGKSG